MAVGLVALGLLVGLWMLTSRGSSTAARGRQLSARLIRPSDLYHGSTNVPPSRPLAGSPMACIGQIPATTDPEGKVVSATTAVRSPSGLGYTIEDVATFTPAQARAQYDQLLGYALHGCTPGKAPVVGPARSNLPGRLSLLTRAATGDESAAFGVPLRDGTQVAVLMARSGGTVLLLQIASKGQVDLPMFHAAAAASVRRLGF